MSASDPLHPTVDDVAALIRARTKDRNGNEVGTFTEDTRPTAAQAQEAIDHAMVAVHEKVGTIPGTCAQQTALCAAYGAAAEIQLSYFPEQARTDRSPYTYLIQRWEEALLGVEACVTGDLPGLDPQGQPVGYGHGTLEAISGVVHDYYTGNVWPPLPPPPPIPHPEPYDDQQ
jgi:hypothetical protein